MSDVVIEIRLSDEQQLKMYEFMRVATEAEVEQGVEPAGCKLCIEIGNQVYGSHARVVFGDCHFDLGEVVIISDR